MQKTDLGHGRGWASPAAAASIRRIDAQLGRLADINEAGRSREKADENYRAWIAYSEGRGPWAPYALPADKSVHVPGNAADSDDWHYPIAAAVWRYNGWRQTARYPNNPKKDEPWHGEYFPHLDNRRNEPAPTGGNTAKPLEGITMAEAIVSAPNGVVVHLRAGGKTNFEVPSEYNTFRDQVAFLREHGATDLMPLPPLAEVPKVTWDTFVFLAAYIGAPIK